MENRLLFHEAGLLVVTDAAFPIFLVLPVSPPERSDSHTYREYLMVGKVQRLSGNRRGDAGTARLCIYFSLVYDDKLKEKLYSICGSAS